MRVRQTPQQNEHQAAEASSVSAFLRQPVIHTNLIVWFTFLAALDVMFTTIALHMGGSELNTVADWVIGRWDLAGMVTFKFGVVVLVVCMVHIIARMNGRAAHRLAEWAVALSGIPVVLAVAQLTVVVYILSDII